MLVLSVWVENGDAIDLPSAILIGRYFNRHWTACAPRRQTKLGPTYSRQTYERTTPSAPALL